MIREIKTKSVVEAMDLGDHNYTVDMEPLVLPDGTKVWDKKAVVRTDLEPGTKGRYLGTVGRDYQPVQPVRIYEMVNTSS
jgi:hypothetical protein